MKSLTGNPSSCTRRSRSCLGRCGKGSPCRWGCRRCCRPLGSPCLTSCNTTCASATRTAWRSCLPIIIFKYLQGVHKKVHFSFPVRRAKVNLFLWTPCSILFIEDKTLPHNRRSCSSRGPTSRDTCCPCRVWCRAGRCCPWAWVQSSYTYPSHWACPFCPVKDKGWVSIFNLFQLIYLEKNKSWWQTKLFSLSLIISLHRRSQNNGASLVQSVK